MKVAVFGLGYVGSVTAAALARDGHEVVGVDVSRPKIELVLAGRAPVLEPGLEAIMAAAVRTGRLRATEDPGDALAGAEISLICVGTPSQRDGSLDLSHVRQVAYQIGSKVGFTSPGHVVVVRSTVLPGSTREVVLPEIGRASGRPVGDGWDVCVNPEFLREGSSLRDYDQPNRILVGERDAGAGERVLQLYRGIQAPVFRTSLEVAEAVKYTDNAFHALKITFANEVARVLDARGVDAGGVMEIVAQDRKLNASPAYLRPGFAFGGSCLPKDLRALTFAARERGVSVPVLEGILPSNELHVRRAIDAIVATGRRRVALLGLAFKAGTDDLRESPLVELAERLIGKGFELVVYDPAVTLGRLHGSNRAFLDEKLPHVSRLLRESIEDAVAEAELVVVGHFDRRYHTDETWRAQGKVVLRLG
jgi:GDP-mannose 6-dehydrogenase